MIQQSTTYTLTFLMVLSSDHLSPATGKTVTVNLSKAGAAFGAAAGAVTEIANGWYKCALTTTDTNTLGDLSVNCTATGCDNQDFREQIVAFNPLDATALGLSRLDAAVSSRMATFTLPTNFSALAITVGGAVTAGTVSDKTGYSLTQAFPANFSALSITAGGLVAQTQASADLAWSTATRTLTSPTFPTNFAALAITAGGAVTAGTVSDKTGYSLSQAFPANFASTNISATGAVLTQGNQGIKKNTALAAFPFLMTDSTNHAPKTALTVTASRSLDGAAYAACANAVVEVGNGMYKIDLAATDLNANTVALRFTATGADDLDVTIVTSP